MRDHLADVRLLGKRRGVEAPHAGERRIEQLELAIGAEQRHPFMQIVDGFALDADQLAILAFEPDLLGDIVIEIGDAAERMQLGDHPERLAARQVPPGLARLEGVVGSQLPVAPVLKFSCSGRRLNSRSRSRISPSVG